MLKASSIPSKVRLKVPNKCPNEKVTTNLCKRHLQDNVDEKNSNSIDSNSSSTSNDNNNRTSDRLAGAQVDDGYVTQAKPFEQIPGPKPSLPFVGTSWIYWPKVGMYKSTEMHLANMQKYYRYGPIFKEEFSHGKPFVIIFDPRDIREVFKREETCPSRPVLEFLVKQRGEHQERYSNAGLANMAGDEWLENRAKLAPMLFSRELKNRTIIEQNRISSRLIGHLRRQLSNATDNVVDNVQEAFSRYSVESIMSLCVSNELTCLEATGDEHLRLGGQFATDGRLIFDAAMDAFKSQHKLFYGSNLWKYYKTKPYRQLSDNMNLIHDIASVYVDQVLDKLDADRENVMSKPSKEHESLIESMYCCGFTPKDIKSNVSDFVSGGIYTVSSTLTMALFLLAANPQVQEKLYKEIRQVFGPKPTVNEGVYVDIEKLNKLKFMKMCVKETYRLLPTIPGVARILQSDIVLSNYVVPRHTLIFCNFLVTCRLEKYFDEPMQFKPERWARNQGMKSELMFALLPFGHGVRKCIGRTFAELELYIAIAKLIEQFKVETIDESLNGHNMELDFNFIVVPRKPVSIKFTERHNKHKMDE